MYVCNFFTMKEAVVSEIVRGGGGQIRVGSYIITFLHISSVKRLS